MSTVFETDVLIIGGGPAGSATALALKKYAPQLSVMMVEASAYESHRVGEVLPAMARGMLAHLGVCPAFEKENNPTVHNTMICWGHPQPVENHFIFSTHGPGWHLDRKNFDAFLARQAEEKGAQVRFATSVKTFRKDRDIWSVKLSDKSEVRARVVVDATGRRAFLARRMGAAPKRSDSLVSFSRLFTLEESPATETAVEAFKYGWWYTARSGNSRVVSCLTDADIAKKLNLNDKDQWAGLLSETGQIKLSANGGELKNEFFSRTANSIVMSKVCGDGWLSVGEAASAFDPLSSQGMIKSLRSGIFASYAIADSLCHSDQTALRRYEKFIRTEFAFYLLSYKKYYSTERRWHDSEFWRRRQDQA